MITFLPLLLVACADYDLATKGEADVSNLADTAGDTGEGPADTEPPIAPAWYAVTARLGVVDGAAVAEGGSVSLEVVDADLERVDCVVELDVGDLAAGEAGKDGVDVWWDLAVTPVSEACATLPEALSLGVGALGPDVRARLGTKDIDVVADSLYGAYLRADGGEAWSFGYAGTEADLSGDDLASFPLPDGVYALAPLYLAPLPEQPEE